MNSLLHKTLFLMGLVMLLGQQPAVADNLRPFNQGRSQSNRAAPNDNRGHSNRDSSRSRQAAPIQPYRPVHGSERSRAENRTERHHQAPAPVYQHYYQPGHRVYPLPYGYSRILIDAAEYFFYDGYFYQPSRTGYVIVEAPLGAIVAALPALHHNVYWHGRPYYIVGNTFYRKHRRGYVVVPNPGIDYRR
ncbi:MAG: hypothetical protein CVV13_07065 [Gammaproteobacteria bacterium HGW-Gammaproteobacteria-3]|nr:MAG: hypothetical protein CVV13_07065 [Gammaproteobacteria bacterium HGW-Gammaproteobacteria-3]